MAKAITASYRGKKLEVELYVEDDLHFVTRRVGSGRLICHKGSWIRQSYQFGADVDRMLLQLVDILNTLFN